MTRSKPRLSGRASPAGRGTGVTAAPPAISEIEARRAAALIRRELSRLTTLLRRHFSRAGEHSLLPALVDTSDPDVAATACAFLDQIRDLTENLQNDAECWSAGQPAAGAVADFRRETMALLHGLEERMWGSAASSRMPQPQPIEAAEEATRRRSAA